MKKIKVHQTTTYIINQLQSAGRLQIHSVYKNTVNLLLGSQLIALQDIHSPLSPISLQTDMLHDKIEYMNLPEGSFLNADIFDFKHALVFDTELDAMKDPFPADSLAAALQWADFPLANIILSLPNHPAPDNMDLIFSFIYGKLQTAFRELSDGNYPQAAKSIATITGAGIGLTPSGDDFLCGLLAGLTLLEKKDTSFYKSLSTEITANLHRTNPISAAFLLAALDGHFSQYICNIKPTSTAHQLTADFGKVGHSSGFDALCGLYFTQVLFPCGTACSCPCSSCRSRTPMQ